MLEAWKNHTSAARREHLHGKLVPMDRPEGEPPLWKGVAVVALAVTLITFIIIAFTGA